MSSSPPIFAVVRREHGYSSFQDKFEDIFKSKEEADKFTKYISWKDDDYTNEYYVCKITKVDLE